MSEYSEREGDREPDPAPIEHSDAETASEDEAEQVPTGEVEDVEES